MGLFPMDKHAKPPSICDVPDLTHAMNNEKPKDTCAVHGKVRAVKDKTPTDLAAVMEVHKVLVAVDSPPPVMADVIHHKPATDNKELHRGFSTTTSPPLHSIEE